MCNYAIEEELLKQNYRYICGIDEVGRGALFGPVVAGAVILDPQKARGCMTKGIKDSKRLTANQRRKLAEFIYSVSVAYAMGWQWNDEIDNSNILIATKEAIKMAIKGLQISPDYVLIDGMKPNFLEINGHGIIKGDNISISIASASIIAKVFRDDLISSLANYFPGYYFIKNKGYGTKEHKNALAINGLTVFHRKSFKLKGKH